LIGICVLPFFDPHGMAAAALLTRFQDPAVYGIALPSRSARNPHIPCRCCAAISEGHDFYSNIPGKKRLKKTVVPVSISAG